MPEDSASTRPAETRRLAAIMFTDIVGFSRQMGANEARMLRLLDVHNQIIHRAAAEHHGHVIKSTGDGFLVEFPSVVNAVQCAQQIQAGFRAYNAEKEPAEQVHLRIGLHLGDIVQHNGDVQGDGVNIAARLQPLAEPDTICISQQVYEEVAKKLALGTVVPLGRPKLKNIAQRFPLFVLFPDPPKGLRQTLRVQKLKLTHWQRTGQVALLLLLLLGAGVLGRHFYLPIPSGLPLPDKPSIAVLPFVNMSGDPEQEYFSDGMTEELTSTLSQLPSLFVIARNSAFTYKGRAVKVQEVGREMGVQYVLEGSVRKAENQVRVTAQFIDAATGYHLWSEHYDRPLREIFAVQDEITQKIATALQLQLTLRERGVLASRPTANPEAYEYYLQALESHFRQTKEGNTQAQQLWERAIALDPKFAKAYAWLGFSYSYDWMTQWSQDSQTLERAFELVQQARALDDSLPLAHTVLGHVYALKREFELAIAEGERAINLNPNDADTYIDLGLFLNRAGQPEKVPPLVERALRLNPAHPSEYVFILGQAYYLMRQYKEAMTTLKDARARAPNFLGPHLWLAAVYSELGQKEEARAERAEVLRISPTFSLEVLGHLYKDPAVVERVLASLRNAGLQ